MKSRRSFLGILGLGAIAAPVAAKAVMEAPAVPMAMSPGAVNSLARANMRAVIGAQREMNKIRSAQLALLVNEQTVESDGQRVWLDWATRTVKYLEPKRPEPGG